MASHRNNRHKVKMVLRPPHPTHGSGLPSVIYRILLHCPSFLDQFVSFLFAFVELLLHEVVPAGANARGRGVGGGKSAELGFGKETCIAE